MEENNIKAPVEEREQTAEELNELLQIRRDKLKALQERGKDPFEIVKFDRDAYSTEIIENYDAMEGKPVTVAGRMMSKRIMGKASFAHILDYKGDIQVYIKRDDVGEESYADFKAMDIGDIIGVTGHGIQNPHGRGFNPCNERYPAFKVPPSPARKVPRAEGSGTEIPPAQR